MNICVPPHRYNRAFDEIAETLRYAIENLSMTGFDLPNRTIIVGAHLLPPGTEANAQRILYNFEQRGSPQLNEHVLDHFQQHEVWDYSPSNVAWLAERGVKAKHVPLGYIHKMTRIKHASVKDIDVLHYGLVNDRRRKILNDLRSAGLVVHEASDCWGQERDALIARSKIVLNVHFYDAGIFEIVRCAYLFANVVCVVSEQSQDVPAKLDGKFPCAPYEDLVDLCQRLVKRPTAREAWAENGFEAFRGCDEVQILREALDGSCTR